MFGLGVGEMALILELFVLMFGAKRIPQIARGLGEGIRNFRTSVKEGQGDQERLEGDSEDPRRLNDGRES